MLLFYLKLKFDELTEELQNTLRQFSPTKIEVKDSNVELMVRERQTALQILSYVQSLASLQNFEITTASLEDVFVSLIESHDRQDHDN